MKKTTNTNITIPIELFIELNTYADENGVSFSKACAFLLNSALIHKPKKVEDLALKDMQSEATKLSLELSDLNERIKKQKKKKEQRKLKRGVEGVDWLKPKTEAEALRFQAQQRRKRG